MLTWWVSEKHLLIVLQRQFGRKKNKFCMFLVSVARRLSFKLTFFSPSDISDRIVKNLLKSNLTFCISPEWQFRFKGFKFNKKRYSWQVLIHSTKPSEGFLANWKEVVVPLFHPISENWSCVKQSLCVFVKVCVLFF